MVARRSILLDDVGVFSNLVLEDWRDVLKDAVNINLKLVVLTLLFELFKRSFFGVFIGPCANNLKRHLYDGFILYKLCLFSDSRVIISDEILEVGMLFCLRARDS
jgi:hypothetical protein